MLLRARRLPINLGILVGRRFRLSILVLGLILILLVAGIFFYQGKIKIPEIDWRFLLGKIAIEKPAEKEKVQESPQESLPLEITLPEPKKKEYTETAELGEGITHLARKALKKYLQENPQNFEITPEHKIYIEDYIKDRTGERGLALGETLTFSEDLIVEAINQARQLTPNQLENLKQYSQLVSSF